MNKLVDDNLQTIVKRINQKNEMLKRQRELKEKLQKRNDEIRSLNHQKAMFEQ